MSPHATRRIIFRAAALIGCVAVIAGCASWQGPRIDPSGDSLIIWPNQAPSPPPPVVTSPFGPVVQTPPPGATVISAPPPGATVIQAPPPIAPATGIGAPMGNLQAPPVYSDPAPVLPPTAGSTWSPFAPNVIAPSVAAPGVPAATPLPLTTMRPAGVPVIATPLGTCAPPGVCYLRLTPNGIMAPVGTEVVLKAGVADCNGTLLVNRSVEWGIAGAGQFTELGAPYQVGLVTWPWQVPRRIAYNHAVGTTALMESTLYRGTPDPNDDVPIARGESWVTISSACEGTSQVTAYAPSLDNYNRVTTQVYWVDAQFIFPQSTTAEAGRPHVLTTTVMRRSDNAPLAGWTVKYDVASGASLGYEGGNTVEATTDAAGRASVEVSPVDAGGGTTNVGVSIYRPAAGSPGGTPPLGLGRGSATITWGAGVPAIPTAPPSTISMPAPPVANPYAPGSVPNSPYAPNQIPPAPPSTAPLNSSPPPSLPNSPPPIREPNPYTPPAGEAAAGKAKLDVTVNLLTPPQVAVGENVRFEVIIKNLGDGTARGIEVCDDFPLGLRHLKAEPGATTIYYRDTPDIAPNQSATVVLSFEVAAEGSQCHKVTVSADGADPVSKEGCVTGIKPAMELRINYPRSRVVGEMAQFNVVVRNGDVPAQNVQVVLKFDGALEPTWAQDAGHQRLADGSILLSGGNIAAREQKVFPIEARCKAASERACLQANLTASGGVTMAAQECVEILPPAPAESGGGIFGP